MDYYQQAAINQTSAPVIFSVFMAPGADLRPAAATWGRRFKKKLSLHSERKNKMPSLSTADELRVVLLETQMAALHDLVDNRMDFSDRQYFNAKVEEYTPPVEE
jgi:hypothetical protein